MLEEGESLDEKDNEKSDNIFTCKLKNISDIEDFTMTQKVFFKMAPLLDPYKYLIGKRGLGQGIKNKNCKIMVKKLAK